LLAACSEYSGATHWLHVERPSVFEYVPGQQGVQTEAPFTEYLPAAQESHLKAACSENFPAVHNEQVAADADVDPVCPYAPAEHRVPEQVDAEVADEYMPAPQLMHVAATDAPNVVEYLQATQLVQPVEASAAEYFPASQLLQIVEAAPAVYMPAPQLMHVAATDAPNVVEYLQATQLVQPVEASAAEYFPASQLLQIVEAAPAVYVPAVHNEQVAAYADVAPDCPYAPAEHRVPEQVDEEVADEYMPA
jgi:hypothetical protein